MKHVACYWCSALYEPAGNRGSSETEQRIWRRRGMSLCPKCGAVNDDSLGEERAKTVRKKAAKERRRVRGRS